MRTFDANQGVEPVCRAYGIGEDLRLSGSGEVGDSRLSLRESCDSFAETKGDGVAW